MPVTINLNIPGALELLRGILQETREGNVRLVAIHRKLEQMAGELDRLTQEVEETKTAVDSAIVFIQGLKAKLDEAIAQLPNPAALNALSDSLDAKQTEIAAAIVANTPAEP